MARTKPTEQEMKRRAILQVIDGNMTYYDVDRDKVSAAVGFSVSTLENRIRDPETFTIGEMWRMNKVLKFSFRQMIQIMTGKLRA